MFSRFEVVTALIFSGDVLFFIPILCDAALPTQDFAAYIQARKILDTYDKEATSIHSSKLTSQAVLLDTRIVSQFDTTVNGVFWCKGVYNYTSA